MNGIERTTFYPTAERITKALGLTIVPDPEPEQGHYYRSDHFSLGKVGIPAVSIDPGHDVVGKGKAWGDEQSADPEGGEAQEGEESEAAGEEAGEASS